MENEIVKETPPKSGAKTAEKRQDTVTDDDNIIEVLEMVESAIEQ